MRLAPGSKLRSAVCGTQVIVIRAAALDVDVRCGGAPMLSGAEALDASQCAIDPNRADGNSLGKRYGNVDLELLVTKAGVGTLAIGSEVLELRHPKPLPASD